MFGCYRVLLASMVVVLHLAGVRFIGEYAVFGFFVLSGYLMTLIMQRNYKYTARGIGAYAINRFLRIYPIYWVACLLSIVILLTLSPDRTSGFNPTYALPATLWEWVRNLGLILRHNYSPMLISPAWALTTELVYYAVIGLGLSRNRGLTLAWFFASIFYTAYLVVSGASWEERYFGITAASLPFSTGAIIFHWRYELTRQFNWLVTNGFAPALLFIMLLLNWAIGGQLGTSATLSFYANFVICSLLVLALHNRRELPLISRRADKKLGDLSYPIYLVHYPLGFMLLFWWQKLGFDIHGPGLTMFALSYVPLILLSWMMAVGVEQQVERLRSLIKTSVFSTNRDSLS